MKITVSRKGETQGPYNVEEINARLLAGELKAHDWAWPEGASDWVPLESIAGIGNSPAASHSQSFGSWYRTKLGSQSVAIQTLKWMFTGFIWIPIWWTFSKTAPSKAKRVFFIIGALFCVLLAVGSTVPRFMKLKQAGANPQVTPAELPPSFRRQLAVFIREGTRLSALTRQGVSYERYGEQYATTAAEFDLLDPEWPEEYQPLARFEFQRALRGWKLTHQFWRRSIQENTLVSTADPDAIRILETYAPGKILHNGPDKFYGRTYDLQLDASHIPYDANIRVLMGTASEHFTSARSFIPVKDRSAE